MDACVAGIGAVSAGPVESAACRPNEQRTKPPFVLPHRQGKVGVGEALRAGDYLRLNKNGLLRTTGRLNEARRRRRRSARRRSNGTKASGAAASAVAMITAPELRCILPRHGGTEGDGAAPGRGWCAPRRCV